MMRIENRSQITSLFKASNSVNSENRAFGEPKRQNRDVAAFGKAVREFAKAAKAAAKSSISTELDKSPEPVSPSITSEEIAAEIDRLKSKNSADSEADVKTAENPPADSTTVDKADVPKSDAAKLLKEQIKSVSEFLSDKSRYLSYPVKQKLQTIYSLLLKQEETDPNSISEELEKEIDEFSKMISSDKSDKTEKPKTLSELLEEQRNKLDKLFSHTESSSNSIGSIKNKIRQGRKLTPYEQRLLSAKDPAAYESYMKINSARTMFRCSLNSCRTRDDVIGMRLSNALTALASYRKATRGGGDGGDIAALNAAFENELRDFARTPGFRSLPTAAECNKFDRDLAKARKHEREMKLEKQREQQRLRNKRYKKKIKKTPGDGKRTVAQVLADPTSKKVMASRRKRACCYFDSSLFQKSGYSKILSAKG